MAVSSLDVTNATVGCHSSQVEGLLGQQLGNRLEHSFLNGEAPSQMLGGAGPCGGGIALPRRGLPLGQVAVILKRETHSLISVFA